MKRIASILLLFLPLLAAAQGRGLNDRITNDLSRLPAMDAVVDSFMTRWSLRGVSLSVMRNDSLVYARGYGRADASRPMTPGTLLRMASVSKLITAVGIMKLQERGKLVLDTPVFGPFGILDGYDQYITDDNYYLITVEHLLRHQAGFTQKGGDPMFSTPSMMRAIGTAKAPTQEQLTRYLLRRPLAYLPGTDQEYSNFGYLLLSMIIEKITGESYEAWTQREVLGPAGCTDFHIGGNFYEDRFPGETRYFMHKEAKPISSFDGRGQVERCYGGNDIHGLSGAGAWIGSTPELGQAHQLLRRARPGGALLRRQRHPRAVRRGRLDRLHAGARPLRRLHRRHPRRRRPGESLHRVPDDRAPVRRDLLAGLGGLHGGRRMDPDRLVLRHLRPRENLRRRRRETGALCKNLRARFSDQLPERDLFAD